MTNKEAIEKSFSNIVNKEAEYPIDSFESRLEAFDNLLEICIQNKDKVDKYSKILTSIFVIAVSSVVFYVWDPSYIVLNLLFVAAFFVVLSLVFIEINTNEDRIYTKFTAILGFTIITLVSSYIAIRKSFFSEGSASFNLFIWGISSMCVWVYIYFFHCLSVYLLDHTIFKNTTINYTTKILDLSTTKNKDYYASFYNHMNQKSCYEIKKEEYKTWKEGSVIEIKLQPRINTIDYKGATLLENFAGKTDMEHFREKNLRDVSLFGRSQEEIDAESGKFKRLSLINNVSEIDVWALSAFVILYLLGIRYDSFFETTSKPIIFNLVIAISFIITSVVLYFEYMKIKTQYTLEDLRRWKDYLLPCCIFYFMSGFMIIGGIVTTISVFLNKYL